MYLDDKQGLLQLQNWSLNKKVALKFAHVDSWNKFDATTTSNITVVMPTDDRKVEEGRNKKFVLWLVFQVEWNAVDSLYPMI